MFTNKNLTAVVLCWTMMVLSSCTTTDNPVTPDEETGQAEYTIIYYANGGTNVDGSILTMIEDLYKVSPEVYKKVNVVVQYKYSNERLLRGYCPKLFSEDAELLGHQTVRWVVDPTKSFYSQRANPDNFYGERNSDFTSPDSLTNFINWAVKAYPAKKYMLVLNDHGGGYRPDDDLPEDVAWPASRRGILYDDGFMSDGVKKHFSVKSLARAIRQTGVHFETIYMLACLMNNMEYLFELKGFCDYIIASTYIMPDVGGALNVLVEQLAQHPTEVEKALDTYCKADVESWDEGWEIDETTPGYTDLTVTRTANLDKLGEVMREFTDRLCDTYANGTAEQQEKIDDCTMHSVKVHLKRPFYDIAKYISSLIIALPEVYGEAFYDEFRETFNSGLVSQHYSRYLTAHDYQVDYSVLLGAEGAYSYVSTGYSLDEVTGKIIEVPKTVQLYMGDGTVEIYDLSPINYPATLYESTFNRYGKPWGSTLDNTYGQLEFDRVVGWSRWLKLNRQHPNLFSPAGMKYILPDDESDTSK